MLEPECGNTAATLMYPVSGVLLDTKWYERDLFFQALLAAEDMKALGQLESISNEAPTEFVLIPVRRKDASCMDLF